jgi:hypothetical protein
MLSFSPETTSQIAGVREIAALAKLEKRKSYFAFGGERTTSATPPTPLRPARSSPRLPTRYFFLLLPTRVFTLLFQQIT